MKAWSVISLDVLCLKTFPSLGCLGMNLLKQNLTFFFNQSLLYYFSNLLPFPKELLCGPCSKDNRHFSSDAHSFFYELGWITGGMLAFGWKGPMLALGWNGPMLALGWEGPMLALYLAHQVLGMDSGKLHSQPQLWWRTFLPSSVWVNSLEHCLAVNCNVFSPLHSNYYSDAKRKAH